MSVPGFREAAGVGRVEPPSRDVSNKRRNSPQESHRPRSSLSAAPWAPGTGVIAPQVSDGQPTTLGGAASSHGEAGRMPTTLTHVDRVFEGLSYGHGQPYG